MSLGRAEAVHLSVDLNIKQNLPRLLWVFSRAMLLSPDAVQRRSSVGCNQGGSFGRWTQQCKGTIILLVLGCGVQAGRGGKGGPGSGLVKDGEYTDQGIEDLIGSESCWGESQDNSAGTVRGGGLTVSMETSEVV